MVDIEINTAKKNNLGECVKQKFTKLHFHVVTVKVREAKRDQT